MPEANSGILTDKLGIISCIKCGVELDVSEYSIFEAIVCPNCNTKQTVPAKLGNFLLRSVIGQGGMGTVYLARDESLGRDVALKVLRAEYGNDPKFYDQLVREAQAAASLNHPNVVQIYSFGQEKGQPYIVMELVNGGRLDQLMENNQAVEERVVLETAIDVAKGLEAAYDAGLIHGDIKPANILYDRAGNAKVVDFGLAKFEGGSQGRGEIWGTPYYIAPEKARGKNEDFRSDQYSLGATLYHALVGRPPFDGKTATDVVVARLKGDAPRVNEVNPLITEQTASVIARMMDPTPARRFPTYQSMQADLQEAMDAAQRAASERDKTPPRPARKSLFLPLTIGITLAIAAGIGAGFYFLKIKGSGAGNGRTTALQSLNYDPAQISDRTPFLRGASMQVTSAVLAYKPGSYIRAFADLNKLAEGQERRGNHVASAWLVLFQGVMLKLEGDAPSMKSALQKLVSDGVPFAANPPPAESPEVLARYLVRLMDEKTLMEKTAGVEPWFADLRNFILAIQYAQEGKTSKVDALTLEYRTRPQTHHWGYAFRPQAVDLARQAALVGPKDLAELPGEQKAKVLSDIKAAGGFPFWSATSTSTGADTAW
ncbi:MAG: protein kinase [Kiritimatiellia bacterium]